MHKLIALSAAAILIGGCDSGTGDQGERKTEAQKQQALRESSFGTITETMDRANNVEQLQMDRKDELDDALDSSEGR